MPLLSRDQVIKEYYETEVRVKYPHITYEQCQEVCKLPFDGVVKWIKEGKFPHIMVKFFGKILVNERRIMIMINKLNKAKELNKISEVYFQSKKAILEDHLESLKQITNRDVKKARRIHSKNIIIVDDIQESSETDS